MWRESTPERFANWTKSIARRGHCSLGRSRQNHRSPCRHSARSRCGNAGGIRIRAAPPPDRGRRDPGLTAEPRCRGSVSSAMRHLQVVAKQLDGQVAMVQKVADIAVAVLAATLAVAAPCVAQDLGSVSFRAYWSHDTLSSPVKRPPGCRVRSPFGACDESVASSQARVGACGIGRAGNFGVRRAPGNSALLTWCS